MRLYGRTDAWLAAALLKMARAARRSAPGLQCDDGTDDARLVWGIVPELSRRLGPVRLETAEIDWEIRPLSNLALRHRIGFTLENLSQDPQLEGWGMLRRAAVNGNPVVYAIDRLCPGQPGDPADRLTRHIAEVARRRRRRYAGAWTPELIDPTC